MATDGRSLTDSLAIMANSMKSFRQDAEPLDSASRARIISEGAGRLSRKRRRQSEKSEQEQSESSQGTDDRKGEGDADPQKVEAKEHVTSPDKEDLITLETIQHLREQKKKFAHDLERIDRKREYIFSKQKELWGVYKFGLEDISKLNDLNDAPDAILPGNF